MGVLFEIWDFLYRSFEDGNGVGRDTSDLLKLEGEYKYTYVSIPGLISNNMDEGVKKSSVTEWTLLEGGKIDFRCKGFGYGSGWKGRSR